ncbi:MAG: Kae1-associated serine/threonine protein kinase [Nanoarchaeota archaeon]|nr:Kae1-associated serine/threonine protein kinase [Nanoarchaeota archaeon]MBU1051072.1 Kae1-associated serine/threonine protein kinase [Nanoarchaeota archaeon]MBU1988484.1 Kae1-associated serine/threonine protein kinase [Nanoarchaeota archaeon]
MTQEEIIQQGAEAILIKKGSTLIKRRVAKGYRIKEIDEPLRKRRTKREAKLLEKAGKIINVPKVLKVDEKTKEIDMEFISGIKLSEGLDEMKNWREVCVAIGRNIAVLHDADIIHGDLTTSNMIWVEGGKLDSSSLIGRTRSARLINRKTDNGDDVDSSFCENNSAESGGKLYFIDFGLGFGNGRVEDKAVDLHLIKQALEAKHFKKWEEFFSAILKGYKISKGFDEVMKRLEKVEKRGRYKEKY